MQKTVFMLVFLFLSRASSAQNFIPYYNLTNEAEWHFDNERFYEAEQLLLQAFDSVSIPKSQDVFMYAKILNDRGEYELAYQAIMSYSQKSGGFFSSGISTYLKDKGFLFSAEQWQALENSTIDEKSERFLAVQEVNRICDSLYKANRSIPFPPPLIDSIEWFNGTDTVRIHALHKRNEIDSSNTVVILRLLEQGKLESRFLNWYDVNFLLLRMENWQIAENQPAILDLVKNGYLDPWSYAELMEKAYFTDGCPIYYTNFYTAKLTCLVDIDEVKERRKSIGLSIYYSKPSFYGYVRPYYLMKLPFDAFYEEEILRLLKE